MESENSFTCEVCGWDLYVVELGGHTIAVDHSYCEAVLRNKYKRQDESRRAYLMSQYPWLQGFLDKFAIWQENHPNSDY